MKKLLHHFEQNWGAPLSSRQLVLDGIEFKVNSYWNQTFESYVYATVGASLLQASKNKREFLIYSKIKEAELEESLVAIAHYPRLHKLEFNAGDTVAGSPGGGIVSGSSLTELLLVPAINEQDGFGIVHMGKDEHVSILWVIPITPRERELVKARGWKDVLLQMADAETAYDDFQRESII